MSITTSPQSGSVSGKATLDMMLAEAVRDARPLQCASRMHATLARTLAAAGRRSEAVEALSSTAQLEPGKAEDYEALAFAAFSLGEHDLARDYHAMVTVLAPRDVTAWYNLASSERNVGQLKAAEEACTRALSFDPRYFQAHLLRSQLYTQTSHDNHVDEMRVLLARNSRDVPAEIFLSYALGKELDDLGAYDEAFSFFVRGARARRTSLQYDVTQDIGKLRRIVQVFDRDALTLAAPDDTSKNYAFVLGLPRSGTTLVERVLTGHPAVRSNGETDNFSTALLETIPDGDGDVFARAARAQQDEVAARYALRAGPAPSGGVVIEKLPLNYLYIGSIHMALPRSGILLVRRNVLDNCFAMYSTLFGSGYPFSYDMQDLARYYAAYEALVAHWTTMLPEQVREISYDRFVASPSAIAPDAASHLGLSWRPDMLRVEDNKSPSATASAVQVRRPIYTSAVGRWKNYAAQLRPLLDSLHAADVDLSEVA